MTPEQEFAKAMRIVSTEFEHVVDGGGAPYMLHLLAVMNGVRHLGYLAMATGLLHDLFEDHRETWTPERLASEGFNPLVVSSVTTLTRSPGEPYEEYIERISHWSLPIEVKLADLEHNMQVSRVTEVTDYTRKRLKKYHEAMRYLKARRTPQCFSTGYPEHPLSSTGLTQ